MNKLLKYTALPLLLSLVILAIALLPAEIVAAVGCRNRGLWAVSIALFSGLLGLYFSSMAVVGRIRGQKTGWLIISGVLYAVPLLLVLIFA